MVKFIVLFCILRAQKWLLNNNTSPIFNMVKLGEEWPPPTSFNYPRQGA